MTRSRSASLVATSLVVAFSAGGCNWMNETHWQRESQGYQFTDFVANGEQRFRVTLSSGKAAELGGPKTQRFNDFLRGELRSRNLCLAGFKILDTHGDKSFLTVTGACVSS
jgi:hypothetical protein